MSDVRYTITITRKTRWTHEFSDNVVTHEEPTDKVAQNSYGGAGVPMMKRDYAVVQKKETRESDEKVYEQTVFAPSLRQIITAILEHSSVNAATEESTHA